MNRSIFFFFCVPALATGVKKPTIYKGCPIAAKDQKQNMEFFVFPAPRVTQHLIARHRRVALKKKKKKNITAHPVKSYLTKKASKPKVNIICAENPSKDIAPYNNITKP